VVSVTDGAEGTVCAPSTTRFIPAVLLATLLGMARPASGQVVPAGQAGGVMLFAGATGSGYYLQYGERKMLGFSGFVDADTRRGYGLEAEGSWMIFHQTANVHTATYMIGPRYHMTFGRYQPYAKALVGVGKFNFPYNYARGSYLVVAPGGGVDMRLSSRIRLGWPTWSISTGLSLPMEP